jgi:hypothetical protein
MPCSDAAKKTCSLHLRPESNVLPMATVLASLARRWRNWVSYFAARQNYSGSNGAGVPQPFLAWTRRTANSVRSKQFL